MVRFLLTRILQAIPVLLAIGFAAFMLSSFVGDPVKIMLGADYTRDQEIRLTHELGLDRPVIVQYFIYLKHVLSGDFGISYRVDASVLSLVATHLPATLELVLASAVISMSAGVLLGLLTSVRSDARSSRIIMLVSLVGISVPTFLLGILLIMVFSVGLGWLPSFGRGGTVAIGPWVTSYASWAGLKALILPALTLGLFQLTLIMRLVRTEMLAVLRTDYIRFATARGLPSRSIYLTHALKNALLPVITVMGLQIGNLIAFAVVTETVFQWPGLGLLLVQSISFADLPVMSAYLLMTGFIFTIINMTIDVIYRLIDPRIS
jgi:peptide/nickel transport system permease protein